MPRAARAGRGDLGDGDALQCRDEDRLRVLLVVADAELAEFAAAPGPDLLLVGEEDGMVGAARDAVRDAMLQPLDHLGRLAIGLIAVPQLAEVAPAPRVEATAIQDARCVETAGRDKRNSLALQRLHELGRCLPGLITVTEPAVLAAAPREKLSVV